MRAQARRPYRTLATLIQPERRRQWPTPPIFRRIALSFEGAGEYPHFDRRAFKARVTFATLAPDELSANVKFAPDEQALKCAVAPDAFSALDNA